MAQLHKRFTDDQVKSLLKRYCNKEIKRTYLQEILGIKRRRFFSLLQKYKDNPKDFSIQYQRSAKTRSLPKSIEKNIIKELKIEQKLIKNPDVPIKRYNYSYVKDVLSQKYNQKVSLPTIINRAKEHGFYFAKPPKRDPHDREVITHYAGELIQHDSSFHLWAPAAKEKWVLITSLDDFSRFILYAILLKRETSWEHILALQTVFLKYGMPFSYYVDSHSIFRFVQGRDSFHRKHITLTDDTEPQWKQVMNDCNVKVIHALSPQAKGKIERPYGWLQDRIVRTCVRQNITELKDAIRVLNHEIHRYNYKQRHSTTNEIPYYRFKNARNEKKSLFREFSIKPPFTSPKDIFCLRIKRTIDSYRKISIKSFELKVNNCKPRDKVELRIYPMTRGISDIRIWRHNKLIDIQRVKSIDIGLVHF